MKQYLNLTAAGWQYGSYPRKSYKTDTLYTFYQYRDFLVVYNMATMTHTVTDRTTERLLTDGLADHDTVHDYLQKAHELFARIDRFDDCGIEDIYGSIRQLRCDCFGCDVLERLYTRIARGSICRENADGIDQTEKKLQLMRQSDSVVFILFQPEYFADLQRDLCAAKAAGKKIYLLAGSCCGSDFPSAELLCSWLAPMSDITILTVHNERMTIDLSRVEDHPFLRSQIEAGKAVLMAYGEECLLHCRSMNLKTILHAKPSWYHTRALTNQFGRDGNCVIYLPQNCNILSEVPLYERTRLTYWHLAQLWRLYGEEIYSMTPEQLYKKYPQMFINVYANDPRLPEMKEEYPVRMQEQQRITEGSEASNPSYSYSTFDHTKDRSINAYLNRVNGLEYHSAWFDMDGVQQDIPWVDSGRHGILVHACKVDSVSAAQVVSPVVGATLRQYAAAEDAALQLYSNFLFFMTPKLAQQYNALRTDRPFEQIPVQKQHLDYALYYKENNRIETFPLFRKACIAKKKDGRFLFFNYRLGGGSLRIGETTLHWSASDVDSASAQSDVIVYAPYGTIREQSEEQMVRYPVGEDRINLVVVQERVICIRKGDVILPSVGVVVSLKPELGEHFLAQNKLQPLQDGYYHSEGLSPVLTLDPPEQIAAEEWSQVEWAYGGGLSLILDGKGLCDEDAMDAWLRHEGWLSALSCQTQESALHQLVRHPRTAIGVTYNGSLVMLVYSGRSRLSIGANYAEMVHIARQLFPDIASLMNVDGGGSAVLGVSVNGSFMELSCPATSFESCAGMVRPVNTALRVSI